jgi:hypothetical protein
MLGHGDTLVWLTPHAAVAPDNGLAVRAWNTQLDDESCRFYYKADGKDMVVLAHSHEYSLEIVDVILRLLAVSVVQSVRLRKDWILPDFFITVPSLEHLMKHCQSLNFLSLELLEMDENHCRVLGAYSRPEFEIEVKRCKITSVGARALADLLGRNQGPTKLYFCAIDNFVLANGLRGNSRLKSLRHQVFSSNHDVNNEELLAYARALPENRGLVDLHLIIHVRVSDDTWGAVCDSLKTHPTLEVLRLPTTGPTWVALLTPAVLQSRIQALVGMLKVNMSIHTIHLNPQFGQHELFRGSVTPYLETNRFRPHLLAIQQARPIPYRAKVLGRALLSARTDANRFWMLLSGNAEVAFPSSTTTVATAANLPDTPTTAAATSTGDAAAVATSATDATTSADTPSTASDAFAHTVAVAAANVATPPAVEKRKACP